MGPDPVVGPRPTPPSRATLHISLPYPNTIWLAPTDGPRNSAGASAPKESVHARHNTASSGKIFFMRNTTFLKGLWDFRLFYGMNGRVSGIYVRRGVTRDAKKVRRKILMHNV